MNRIKAVVLCIGGAALLFQAPAAEGRLRAKPSEKSYQQKHAAPGGARPRLIRQKQESEEPNYREGEVLVRFRGGMSAAGIDTAAAAAGARMAKRFERLSAGRPGTYGLVKSDTLSTADLMKKLERDPAVESVWPNHVRRIDVTTPDDPAFGQLWGLRNIGQGVNGEFGTNDADIDAPEAWDVTTGDAGVVVAVVDTGVDYAHVDLAANMWVNTGETPGNLVDDDFNGYVDDVYGIDPENDDGDPMDDHGHGTHVAGTIAAVGNDDTGVVGVNWQAGIMALKGLNEYGNGSDSNLIEAIEYAVSRKLGGVNVVAINASWGGGGGEDGDPLSLAIQLATDSGIVFCAAAGNDSTDNDVEPHYPSSYSLPGILAVAATDQDDMLASFSGYGLTSVDLAAPGVNILSTVPEINYLPAPGDHFWDDMESGDGNWVHDGIFDSWALSTENAHSPVTAWSDSPGGDFLDNTDSHLAVNGNIDLSSFAGANIALGFWAELDLGADDLYIEISSDGGATWTEVGWLDGYAGWELYTFMIPESHKTAAFRFRFHLDTTSVTPHDGVHIDDVGIGLMAGSAAYDYSDGTSMATPHVAGAVALAAAAYPGDTMSTRINRVLSGADVLPSLSGVVATGGRLNLANSVDPALVFMPRIADMAPAQGLLPGTAFSVSGDEFGAGAGQVLFMETLLPPQRTSQFRFRFHLVTDGSWSADGVHIDDVRVASEDAEYFSDDIESGAAAWMTGGVNNNWMISGESSHSPSYAWTDSNGSNYLSNTDSFLAANSDIDLSGTEGESVSLGFWAQVEVETGYDNLYVEVSNDGGATWYRMGTITGYASGWQYFEYSIPGPGVPAVVTSWSETAIAAEVPPGAGGRLIVVEKAGGKRSLPVIGSAWSDAVPTNTGRDGAATVVHDGKIYVFGGFINGGSTDTDTAEVFDPPLGIWLGIPPMPGGDRARMAAASLGGKIYVIGGYGDYDTVDRVEAYDPSTSSWSQKAPLPIPLSYVRAAALGGRIYATGGLSDGNDVGHFMFEYDPLTDSWTQGPSMMADRYGHASAVVNGRLYVLGGVNEFDDYLSSVEYFDPATGVWSHAPPLPAAMARMGAATDGQTIYLAGGTDDYWSGSGEAAFMEYDPVTGMGWHNPNGLENLYVPRLACGGAYLDGYGLYALNGYRSGNSLDSVEHLPLAPPPPADELAADLGPDGLWLFDGISFDRISEMDISVQSGWSGGLAAGVAGGGLMNYDGEEWVQLAAWDPEGLAGWTEGLAVDFGASGLWSWSGAGWSIIASWDCEGMEALGDLLVVDFGANGLWTWNGSAWEFLASWDPEGISTWSGGLAADFGANGLWNHDGVSWTYMASWDPENISDWPNGLAADFGAGGLWNYGDASWEYMASLDPESLAGWTRGMASDFGPDGFWTYNGFDWSMISPMDPEGICEADVK